LSASKKVFVCRQNTALIVELWKNGINEKRNYGNMGEAIGATFKAGA
jgi:hypothetical protein